MKYFAWSTVPRDKGHANIANRIKSHIPTPSSLRGGKLGIFENPLCMWLCVLGTKNPLRKLMKILVLIPTWVQCPHNFSGC